MSITSLSSETAGSIAFRLQNDDLDIGKSTLDGPAIWANALAQTPIAPEAETQALVGRAINLFQDSRDELSTSAATIGKFMAPVRFSGSSDPKFEPEQIDIADAEGKLDDNKLADAIEVLSRRTEDFDTYVEPVLSGPYFTSPPMTDDVRKPISDAGDVLVKGLNLLQVLSDVSADSDNDVELNQTIINNTALNQAITEFESALD